MLVSGRSRRREKDGGSLAQPKQTRTGDLGRGGTTICRSGPYLLVSKSTAHEYRSFPLLLCLTDEDSQFCPIGRVRWADPRTCRWITLAVLRLSHLRCGPGLLGSGGIIAAPFSLKFYTLGSPSVSVLLVANTGGGHCGLRQLQQLPALSQGSGKCDALGRAEGQAGRDTTTQKGGEGSNNRPAKTAQHGPQGARHTSKQPLISRLSKCPRIAGCQQLCNLVMRPVRLRAVCHRLD